MGNYSSDPNTTLQSALDHGYTRVRFQQGKPILDRELNLVADLAAPERFAQQYVGDGVPSGSQGFQITGLDVAGNNFNITPGRCLVGGREAVLAAPVTYKGQPNNTNVQPLPAGASNVYLRVFTTEIAAAQDPGLNNSGDVGFETAIREKTDWEVLVSVPPINAPGHLLLAIIDTGANTVIDKRRTGLTLAGLDDEVTAARGSASALADRLKSNDLTVAAVQSEITAARGTAAQLTGRLDTSLAGDGSIKPGAVSIQKMASAVVFNAQVSIAAAPGAGQKTEQPITILNTDQPAFLLVSVHYDGPRPISIPIIPMSSVFQWRYQVMLFKPIGATTFNQHIYQVIVENPNAVAISVTVKAYRLAEV